jgi:exodeoxyribonuclease V alpha subunit
MTTHLTVRLAWHDNKWNGTICKNPTENAYCVGSHSLLSERIARDRDLEKESAKPCHKLDVLMPDYLPPCFWSSCAFSDDQTEVVHAHPFSNFRQTKRISQTLPESSVYTWPFRLSITHGRSAQNKHGQ